MPTTSFAGHLKVGTSLLHRYEQALVKRGLPYIPKTIETYHLTLSTIAWSFGVLVFSYFAKSNYSWLWGVSLMIFLQYVTDLFDGAVGRMRHTGLIKWGYYMDHLLDYGFLCSLLIGYSFFLAEAEKDLLFFVLATFGAFMVNSFLSFAASNEFRISYFKIGPTELRLTFIFINSLLALFGTTHLGGVLPYLLLFLFASLSVIVYQTQQRLWQLDMESKATLNERIEL